jgi:hypothetical protein
MFAINHLTEIVVSVEKNKNLSLSRKICASPHLLLKVLSKVSLSWTSVVTHSHCGRERGVEGGGNVCG